MLTKIFDKIFMRIIQSNIVNINTYCMTTYKDKFPQQLSPSELFSKNKITDFLHFYKNMFLKFDAKSDKLISDQIYFDVQKNANQVGKSNSEHIAHHLETEEQILKISHKSKKRNICCDQKHDVRKISV